MLKRKCSDCAKKIDKKYLYCPWCGVSIKGSKDKANFGLLGKSDDLENQALNQNPLGTGLPFGLDKMVGPLMKQLEKELSNIDKQNPGMPKNIKISFGNPNMMNQQKKIQQNKQQLPQVIISEEEKYRRQKLPKAEAKSKVKRLSDKIIYEIDAPGIKNKSDISIAKLEEGFEVKAYTKDKCYIKNIPFEIEITNLNITKDKVILEMKSD